jgi:3-phenylpropionate/trans-cinnamate dioxygenase ferredoxin reductase component
MPAYKYLIIGAGMTADAAAKGIRELDTSGSIGIVGNESDPPYDRPPLTKGLWKGKAFDKIWRGTQDARAMLHLGRRVVSFNAGDHTARDDADVAYTGEKVLLATGGTPRRLPFGGENILYYRTVADYRRLRDMADQGPREFAVIGGGFIGSEIAAALAMNGQKVTMLLRDETIGGSAYPPDLGHFVTDYYRKKAVQIVTGDEVAAFRLEDGKSVLQTKSGQEIMADSVVAGLGIRPNTQLAAGAGLKVDDGIVVDEQLESSASGVYAAGDVAQFFNPALEKRMRVEHEDNANVMGRQAGRNLAGAAEPYHHLPYFYSDLFDLGYEAVGELDTRMETFADWQERFRKGVVYYLDGGRVRGVLLWNVWETVPKARALIAEPGPFTDAQLRGRLP